MTLCLGCTTNLDRPPRPRASAQRCLYCGIPLTRWVRARARANRRGRLAAMLCGASA